MTQLTTAPYGGWKSPISADLVAAGGVRLGQIKADAADVYWIEGRPAEAGRNVIVRWRDDHGMSEVTPAGFNARTRVHEYGGGAYAVGDGIVFFCNDSDQRVYEQRTGKQPQPLTLGTNSRYADLVFDRSRDRIICVREDHISGGEPVNSLVGVCRNGEGVTTLASGADFYSTPRLSPDGERLAWLQWNHPNMPWDDTELWCANLAWDGSLGNAVKIAGRPEQSIFQPEWSPDGVLHFVSDQTGWWNLYRIRDRRIEPLCKKEAEFGLPQWVFGLSTYAFANPQEIVCSYVDQGISRLARLDCASARLWPIETPYTDIGYITAAAGNIYFHGGAPDRADGIIQLDPATGRLSCLHPSTNLSVDKAYCSSPQVIEFSNHQNQRVFSFFYPPKNPDFAAAANESPPLIVISHGGPTSASSNALKLGVQYWTSRGFAVLDVNYGGSTGFGRDYRRRLDGAWGVVDVADCVAGARHLAEQGWVDAGRLVIRGNSAGGYTTLCALTFYDCFKAGASYYGVSDLAALAQDTHKFESRYLDRLVGPYPSRKDLYAERSPINFVDRLNAPAIFLQGLEDRVVPPNQAEKMVAALRAKGLAVAYVAFEGEQHGFRQAQTIKRALEAELYFYSKVFEFDLPDPLEPVPIDNLHR